MKKTSILTFCGFFCSLICFPSIDVNAETVIRDDFKDVVWNVPSDSDVYNPWVSSNLYIVADQNSPIGINSVVDGFSVRSNDASAYLDYISHRPKGNWGITKCNTAYTFNPESNGIECSSGWDFLSFSNSNQINASSDNKFIMVTLYSPVTLNSSYYYAVSLDTGGNYGDGDETLVGTNNTVNLGNVSTNIGQRNLTTFTPVTGLWLEFWNGSFDSPIPPPSHYAKINNTASGALSIYSATSTGSNVLKNLPEDWVVQVSSTTNSTGNQIINNGYRWYQVIDPSDGVTGWMFGANSSGTTKYLDYLPSVQTALQDISEDYVATSSRPALILEAVDHYYNNASTTYSLYSSDDVSSSYDISQLKNGNFPEEVVWGIIAQESSIVDFDNEHISGDYGHGIMQITMSPSYPFDNRGISSRVTIPPCSLVSSLYTNCYTNTGNSNPKEYRPYSGSGSTYKQYTNTEQSIYSNIKDGMSILAQKYDAVEYINSSVTVSGTTYTANERKNILATQYFNGGNSVACQYVDLVADRLDDINDYFAGATTSSISTLVQKMHIAGTNVICAQLESPGDLSIQDSKGRTVGVVNGQGKNEFPLAIYDKEQKFVVILAAEDEEYTLKVTGSGKGTYGINITQKRGEQVRNFHATDMPITKSQIHKFTLNKDNSANVTIDRDSDGKPERSFKVSHEYKGSFDQTELTVEEKEAIKIGDKHTPYKEVNFKYEGADKNRHQSLEFRNQPGGGEGYINAENPYYIIEID